MFEKKFGIIVEQALEKMKIEPYDYILTHEILLEITRKFLNKIDELDGNTNEKYVLIYAGPNASGKSTIASKVHQNLKIPFLNPDMIAKILFDSIENEVEKYKVHAMPYTEKLRNKLIDESQSFAMETVFSDPRKLNFVSDLKKQGYKIFTVWMGTDDPKINLMRGKIREELGGHIVPVDKILSRYYKSMDNLYELLEMSDDAFIIDNSFDKPVVVFRKSDEEKHKSEKVVELNWVHKYVFK